MSKTISEVKAAKERLEDQISGLLMKFEEENGVPISDLRIYPREICYDYGGNDRSPNRDFNYRQNMKKILDACCGSRMCWFDDVSGPEIRQIGFIRESTGEVGDEDNE
jgi:hypothetical protein